MYLVFLILWIIFNEKFNLEILLLGLLVSAAVFLFVCKFMDYSASKELAFYKKLGKMLCYVIALLGEILMANLKVCRLILSEKEEIEPVLAAFTSEMETPAGQAFYANAITLTPGTITVSAEGQRYEVHCLDEELAEGLMDSGLEKRLRELEG